MPALRVVASESDLPDTPPPGPQLDELLERYVRVHPALGPEAIGQYRNAVNLASAFLTTNGFGPSCDELFSIERLCDFFRALGPGAERSAATVNGRIDVVWMLWSFAHDEGLTANPLPPPRKKPRAKEPKKDPVAFTIEQIVQLIASCLRAPPMAKVKWWTSDHWVSLISVYLSTAERFQALLKCPRTALLGGNVFMVPATLTKDRKEHPVTIPDWIAEKIRRLPVIDAASGPSDLLWPYPFRLKQLRERYTRDVLLPAGLPHTRWHKFHCLRRTAVTQVKINQGLEKASELARHFGQGLTLDRYVSQAVVQQQTGTVAFHVPAPPTNRDQLRLF